MPNHVFPQHGDVPDAANFAQMLGRRSAGDYVETGLEVQNIDYNGLTFDVTAGKAFVLLDSMETQHDDIDPPETRMSCGVVVELEARTDIALTDGETNYVYIDANMEANDTPEIVVNTTGTSPSDESLRIARIDTVANSSEQVNRNPSTTLDGLEAQGNVNLPDDTGLRFGNNDDWEIIYDSSEDRLEFNYDPNGVNEVAMMLYPESPRYTLDMNDTLIRGVNRLIIADAGPGEGLQWEGHDAMVDVSNLAGDNNTGEFLRLHPGTEGIAMLGDSLQLDDTHHYYGNNRDFSWVYDGDTDELRLVEDPNGSPRPILVVPWDETPDFPQNVTAEGDPVVSSSSGRYDIQVNGQDGAGIINFKT